MTREPRTTIYPGAVKAKVRRKNAEGRYQVGDTDVRVFRADGDAPSIEIALDGLGYLLLDADGARRLARRLQVAAHDADGQWFGT